MKPAIKRILILGTILAVGGPLAGFISTVVIVLMTFHEMDNPGTAEMVGSDTASMSLIGTAIGLGMGGVGIVILLIGLICWLVSRSQASSSSKPPTDGA